MKKMKLAAGIVALGLIAACSNNGGKPGKAAGDSTKTMAANQPVPGTPIKYDSSKHYIFLTLDDSPQPPGTINCKNIFHQQAVKATFFSVGFNQVGPFKKRIIDSIRNAYPEFLLANHSFTHAFNDNYKKFYNMPDSAVQDFLKNEKELQVAVKIIRLPGMNTWVGKGQKQGPASSMKVAGLLDSLGFTIIGWDLEWGQQKKMKAPLETADEMVKRVNKKFDDGSTFEQNAIVILSHDRLFEKKQYADSLSKFISILKQDPRNVFETIDHYPLVQNK